MTGILTLLVLSGCTSSSAEEDPEEALAAKVVGTWQARPPDIEIRRLKVIEAAMAGQPGKKQALGDLTNAESTLFDEWAAKRGPAAQNMKAELRFMEGAVLEFTDTQATVRLGGNVYGPADYELVSATEAGVQLRFDPGLGNGIETHDITWNGPDLGIDVIATTRRGGFSPLQMQRR